MKRKNHKNFYRKNFGIKIKRNLLLTCCAFALCAVSLLAFAAKAQQEKLEISANFVEREIQANEKIELKLNRDLRPDEGRFAFFVGNTDLTALFTVEPQLLSYTPRFELFPVGENTLKIYTVSAENEWENFAEFPLKAKAAAQAENVSAAAQGEAKNETIPAEGAGENTGKFKVSFTPNVSLNLKGQNQTLTFPRESAPERNPFTDLAGQSSLNFKIERSGWALQAESAFAGSTFSQESLRFGELGTAAPNIDLSSYLIQFGKGRFAMRLGHVSFGSNRHLINSFSSRGVSVTVPVGKQNEISVAAMNGTSIVGFNNFVGITQRKHSVVSTTFAREFFKERPNGLRVEFSVMRGSLLPLNNFNGREVNDAEKSLGYGVRVLGSNTNQRLRFEGGFTRSRFTNPADPLLEQGFDVTEIRPVSRSARYAEVSFDFLQGLKLWEERKLKVTGTIRHEEIEPLFRSIVASTQADRRNYQFEVAATFGEMNFAYGNLRDRDNLRDLPSILETVNRRSNVVFGVALNTFFTGSKPIKWLPRVGYTYDHVHQFGAFFPVNGEFRDLSQIPDQDSFAQGVNADWQFSDKFRVGYRYNRAFQDNKQPGRDLADFLSAVNVVSVGTTLRTSLDLNFDLSLENQKNFEQPRTDRTFRVGSQIVWRMPFPKNGVLSANLSTTLSGDTDNANDTRSAEIDVQWAYKFNFGKEKFKKMDAQFFIRYANRYGDARDRLFFLSSFNKTQAFNAGLTFNFF